VEEVKIMRKPKPETIKKILRKFLEVLLK